VYILGCRGRIFIHYVKKEKTRNTKKPEKDSWKGTHEKMEARKKKKQMGGKEQK